MPLVKKPRHIPRLIAVVLAALAVGLCPLAMGAVHIRVQAIFTVVTLIAFLLHGIDKIVRGRRQRLPWQTLPFGIAIAATAFALLPLPSGIIDLLMDGLAADRTWMLAPASEAAQSQLRSVLSPDPPETALALARLLSALFVFLVLADQCRKAEMRRLVVRIIVVCASLTLLVAVVHSIARMTHIYGIFPMKPGPYVYGPMYNANNQARIFGALSFLFIGRAAVLTRREEMIWFIGLGFFLGAATFLTLSRGAAVAYLATALFFASIWARSRQRNQGDYDTGRKLLRFVVAEAVVIALVVAFVAIAYEGIAAEAQMTLAENEEGVPTKFAVYGPALDLIRRYWMIGVSPGGFQTTFPQELDIGELSGVTWSYVENVFLEVFVHHGVIIGLALLLSAAAVGYRLLRSLDSPPHLAFAAPIFFLVVSDLFDFVLHTGAGLMLLALLLGLAVSIESRDTIKLRAPAIGALLFCAVALAASSVVVSLDHPRYDMQRELKKAETAVERRDIMTGFMVAHPLDGHFAYGLAVSARQQKDVRQALAWANRSLFAFPNHAAGHVEAARALAAAGKLEQALVEYRLAWQAGAYSKTSLLREVALRTDDVELRAKAIPDAEKWALCNRLRNEKKFVQAAQCALNLKGDAVVPEAMKYGLQAALHANDDELIRGFYERVKSVERPDGEMAVYIAEATRRLEGLAAAMVVSDALLTVTINPVPLLRWRIEQKYAAGNESEALRDFAALRGRGLNRDDQNWADRFEAAVFERTGALSQALQLRRKIAARMPTSLTEQRRLIGLEIKLGLASEAERTLRRIESLTDDKSEIDAWRLRVREADQARVRRVIQDRSPR